MIVWFLERQEGYLINNFMGPQWFRLGVGGEIGVVVRRKTYVNKITKTINADTNVSRVSFIGDVNFGSAPVGFGGFATASFVA